MGKIDSVKQNKPSLVVKDISEATFPTADVIYHSLWNRGIFKWLAVRRNLIKLQHEWRQRLAEACACQHDDRMNLKETIEAYTETGDPDCERHHRKMIRRLRRRIKNRSGYIRALNEAREEVRALCHSPRDQVQDDDPMSQKWLEYHHNRPPEPEDPNAQ